MLAGAALCTAHARLTARRERARNEKRLIEPAGLDAVQTLLANPGARAEALEATVAAAAAALGIEPLTRALKRRRTRPCAGPARAAGRPA
jgi:hypothetical protein